MDTAVNLCIECGVDVTRKKHAVDCDICNRWQHRLCGTGINHLDYRLLMEGNIRGCSFHWSQALYKKVKSIGLSTAYESNPAVHEYIRQLLALPFLPAEQIPAAFQTFHERTNRNTKLRELVDYIDRQWISDRGVFTPKDWSVFGHTIRTNNGIEAWHRRINMGGSNLNFYKLVPVLRHESDNVQKRVTAADLEETSVRYTKKCRKLQEYWDSYMSTPPTLTTAAFLKKCSSLYSKSDTTNRNFDRRRPVTAAATSS